MRKKWTDITFPLMVSAMLILVIALYSVVILKAQTQLFNSQIDRFSLWIGQFLILFLIAFWMLILCCESFRLSFGRFYQAARWLLFFIYYPMGRIMGWLLRTNKTEIQTSIIDFQNQLFLTNFQPDKHTRLLVLLPHCLQFHDCKVRITRDINDCADCGDCDICQLKDLGKRYDIQIGIANGGTLARKIVNETQPDAIIAVACHRDLTDGVRESWHYPVYAVLNERPYGPCHDTRVNVDTVESIIKKILI